MADKAADGGGIDDSAAPLLPHHRQNILGGQKDAGGIDLHHLHPLVLHHFLDGLADVDAGVVHHHVDVALLPQHLPDGGIHQLLTGDVRHQMVQTLYALRPAAQLIYRIARRLQRQSRLLSDTGGPPGDNCYLTHALPAPPP